MAIYKGNAAKTLKQAEQKTEPLEQVRMLIDAVAELEEELRYVLGHLGPENFTAATLTTLVGMLKEEG